MNGKRQSLKNMDIVREIDCPVRKKAMMIIIGVGVLGVHVNYTLCLIYPTRCKHINVITRSKQAEITIEIDRYYNVTTLNE